MTETIQIEELTSEIRKNIKLNPHTLALVDRLKSKGLYLGILSNHTSFWFDYIAERYNFYDYFERPLVLESSRIATAKPEPSSYLYTYDNLKKYHDDVTPSQVVFIDDKKANTDAAEVFGFRAIQWNGNKESIDVLEEKLVAHIPKMKR
jgi:HAD superfamily hydrolase (TIGR01509 family)